jgi:hypothetical protein
MAFEVVQSGTWTYGEDTAMPVHVVRADFDFWYEVAAAEDQLEPGETPALNDDGLAYYVLFREVDPDRFWPDDGPAPSAAAARRVAEQRVPSAIRWQP